MRIAKAFKSQNQIDGQQSDSSRAGVFLSHVLSECSCILLHFQKRRGIVLDLLLNSYFLRTGLATGWEVPFRRFEVSVSESRREQGARHSHLHALHTRTDHTLTLTACCCELSGRRSRTDNAQRLF